MLFNQPRPAFNPKEVARRLVRSRARDSEGWRSFLASLSGDQLYYVQKELLERHQPEQFEPWFGFGILVDHLSQDPLLPSMKNPSLWLYAFDKAQSEPMVLFRVLNAYWSGASLMRPNTHMKPAVLANIHAAVRDAILVLTQAAMPWAKLVPPMVLSYPEESELFTISPEQTLSTLTNHLTQYRDLATILNVPMVYPATKTLIHLLDLGIPPESMDKHPLPWPHPDNGVWPDDLWLSYQLASKHPQLCRWWTLPMTPPPMPVHLEHGALVLNMGLQLQYLAPFKEWLYAQS